MSSTETAPGVSLLHEQRQLARDRIERAALRVLADKGLSATAEEVALEAGVSIRTVFRHYGTRDHMIATALRTQLLHYGDTLPVPEPGATLETWLPELLCEVHRVNAVMGRAYWEMAALGYTLTGEIGDVAAERLAGRTRFVNTVSRGVAAGRESLPPAGLVGRPLRHPPERVQPPGNWCRTSGGRPRRSPRCRHGSSSAPCGRPRRSAAG